MKKFFATVMVVLFVVSAGSVFAQQSQQQEEMVVVPKSALTAEQKVMIETQNLERKIQTYGKWVGMGEEVGKAVNGALKALTTQAEDFSKTPLGHFTMFLVAWKVMGKDAVQAVVGLLLLFVGIPVWIWFFRKNCIPHRILIEKSKGVAKYEAVNTGNKDEEKWGHVVVLGLYLGISLLVLFA
jgi:hypothetical protein